MKIFLTDEQKFAAGEFSQKVLSTNLSEYSRRKQTNVSLIKSQIYEGKLAEFAVCDYFNKFTQLQCGAPDLNIYEKGQKSFAADLVLKNGTNVHVKSQNLESVKRYGKSWICQKNDPLVKNPSPHDMVVFCLFCGEFVEIVSLENAKVIKWGEPKLDKLKGNKVAYYL